jgi:WG containing repeat
VANGDLLMLRATGFVVITPQFDDALGFSGGLAAAKIDGKVGFIDKSGLFVITPQFDMFGNFQKEH